MTTKATLLDEAAREDLAMRIDLDPLTQRALAEDPEEEVRSKLAANTHATPEVQELLARDTSSMVRFSLSANRSLTCEAARLLGDDDERLVLRNLASNPSVQVDRDSPMRLVQTSPYGEHLFKAALKEPGVDRESVLALLPGWRGTINELLATAQELAAEPAPR
jgi:hypothetical protein